MQKDSETAIEKLEEIIQNVEQAVRNLEGLEEER